MQIPKMFISNFLFSKNSFTISTFPNATANTNEVISLKNLVSI